MAYSCAVAGVPQVWAILGVQLLGMVQLNTPGGCLTDLHHFQDTL